MSTEIVDTLDSARRRLNNILNPSSCSLLARLKDWDEAVDVIGRYEIVDALTGAIENEAQLKQRATRALRMLEQVYTKVASYKWTVLRGAPVKVSYNAAQHVWFAEDGSFVSQGITVTVFDTAQEAIDGRLQHLNTMIAGQRMRINELKAEIKAFQEEYEALENLQYMKGDKV